MKHYCSNVFTGTELYTWVSTPTQASQAGIMGQGAISSFGSGGTQAGQARFVGLANSIDLEKYRITQINLSCNFTDAGGDLYKWIRFYFAGVPDDNYRLEEITTFYAGSQAPKRAHSTGWSMNWSDADSLKKFEQSLKMGNEHICIFNEETVLSGYSDNYLQINSIYLSYNYEDRLINTVKCYDDQNGWSSVVKGYVFDNTIQQTTIVPPTSFMPNQTIGGENSGDKISAAELGYSCFASHLYPNLSGYSSYYAFDKITGDNNGWASSPNCYGENVYLNLSLPKSAYLQTVTIANRASHSDGVCGPKVVDIVGYSYENGEKVEKMLLENAQLPGTTPNASTIITIPEDKNNILIQEISIKIKDWEPTTNYVFISEASAEVIYPWKEIQAFTPITDNSLS